MLLKLRGGMNSFFVTALLGVLIASFAIFGIGSSAFTSGNQQVASVGDTPVSTNAFYNRVQNRARTLQVQYGGQMSVQQIITNLRLDQAILGQMMADAAMAEHLSDLGMRAGNAELRKELESYEGLVLPDGSLSRELVLQVLSNTGMSRAEFMTEIRRSISQRYLAETLGAEPLMPRGLAEQLYKWDAELRKATLIDIKSDAISDVPAPTDTELTEYFDLNKAAYRTEETRSYNYLLITPERFMDEITVEEDQILQEYEGRSDEYNVPEQRSLQQVSFTDKAAADSFILAVKSGANFAEAAASVTDFTAEEIELGDFNKSEVTADFGEDTANAIFALEESGVTEALEGFGGWNVFKVASITAAQERSLDEAREEIVTALKQYDAENRMYEVVDTLSEAMAEETSLTAIAQAAGLNVASVTDVNRRGNTPSGSSAVTQAAEYTILLDAFRKEVGVEADLMDIDPSDSAKGVYMLEVTNLNESADQELSEVRGEVVEAWTAEKRLELVAALAEQAKERLAAGETAEGITLEIDATSFEAKNVARRGDSNSSLASNIRSLIFDLDKGEIDYERSSDGSGYVVVRVDEINPGDPAARPAAVDTLLDQMNGQFVNELDTQYRTYLNELYDTSINYALLETLFTDNNQ